MALGQYDIAEYSSVENAYPDPDTNGFMCDQIVSAAKPDGNNNQGYCNPAVDDLFKKQAVTVDPTARKEMFNQIEQLMYDDVIYIGMWKDPDLWSVSSRLKNVRFSGVYPFWNAYEWEISQ
jgi:peptide/nickel transport system substrate-binding protein